MSFSGVFSPQGSKYPTIIYLPKTCTIITITQKRCTQIMGHLDPLGQVKGVRAEERRVSEVPKFWGLASDLGFNRVNRVYRV